MAELKTFLHSLRQKGNLAYEYHPFRNYQTNVDLYKVDNFIIPKDCAVNPKNGELLKHPPGDNNKWVDKRGIEFDVEDIKIYNTGTLYAKAGSLINFDTQKLNFDLDHPVDIEILPSYDGSVNLILNDDKNPPRLINSRFSVREKNTYEIVDRIGENDTNVYSSDTFDKDTSLYYHYEVNPKIDFKGYVKGVLPVGQYCFYFTYCDADENESDYIAESGLIPLFIGTDSDPMSMDGGIKNQNSNKGVRLELTNLDNSYSYLKIYYVRYFADYGLNRVYECKKIYKKYPLNSSVFQVQINGSEEAEDLDPNILNISRFNPKHLLTQALCKNMLFFGNIVKNSDNYRELSDVALRITPELINRDIDLFDVNYNSTSNNYAYYDSKNIYNEVGYFNNEYYRFGVVFIYNDGSLSNVYNTIGATLDGNTISIPDELFESNENNTLLLRNYIKIDNNGWIIDESLPITTEDTQSLDSNGLVPETPAETSKYIGNNLNAKGVCKISIDDENNKEKINTIYGIKFNIPKTVQKYLKEDLGIRGLFFVRQKCIPNILAQCLLMPMDEVLEAPVIKLGDNYLTECFIDDSGFISNIYKNRLYKYKTSESISNTLYAAICPDFLLNQPYYNQIFNSSKFRIQKIKEGKLVTNLERKYDFDYSNNDYDYNNPKIQVTICSVTDAVPSVAIKDKVYKLEMGAAEESYRFKWVEVDNGTYTSGNENAETGENLDRKAINAATNMSRGVYSPYLAIYSETALETNCIYNIYSDNELNETLEFQNRMDSYDAFYAISDRYNFENLPEEDHTALTCWRGDCFINMYTHRLNRNFNDPTLPNNDQIIDPNTWKKNYDAFDSSKWTKILRSDLNAVQMGSWITFPVKSAMNYALRSQDHSYVSEEALMGSSRSYYPRTHMMWKGVNKMPDSYLYNDAYRATLGFKCYFTLNDINYIKDSFSNRIQYSAISIQDSFKNNYRYSLSTYFRDYSQEYGSITKLVGFEGYLLVVFEHAIGIAVVNERVLAGGGDGEPVFINTANVLPEELTIITDTYGTQWSDSVIKSEAGYVYGVDTIAKKIWRVKGQQIEILSDFTVGKFLIDNISLGEREVYPTIGLRNVKTHYNNNKKDIMFTFYDDVYEDEEKVWNLCYNELLGQFITFYSWVPGFSENIDTQFFTFDRQTVKKLALLGKHNYSIPENQGVLVDNPVMGDECQFTLWYSSRNPEISVPVTIKNDDGTTTLKEITISEGKTEDIYHILNNCNFTLEHDHWKNYNKFELVTTGESEYNGITFKFKLNLDGWDEFNRISDGGAILNSNQNYLLVNEYYNTSPNLDEELKEKRILWDSILELRSGDESWLKQFIRTFPSEIDEKNRWYYSRADEFEYRLLGLEMVIVDNNDNYNGIKYYKYKKERNYPFGCLSTKFKNWIENTEKWESSEELAMALSGGLFLLKVTPYLEDVDGIQDLLSATEYHTSFKTETIAVACKDFLNNQGLTEEDKLTRGLMADFYLHGQAGIFNVVENLYPCWWYGKQHPFEFEFVVNDKIGQLKIFTDLEIISNKAEPESFHFEIEGDNYEFSNDKRTMYFRQEATKNLFLNLGSDMLYDRKFTDVAATMYTQELYYRDDNHGPYPIKYDGLVRQVKSTIFPLYYERTDTYDEIYHDYKEMICSNSYDFKNLSGSEIKWNRDLNQFNIVTHIKNSPIDLVGRLRGNSRYKEGKWHIQIPSIIFNLKNETDNMWVNVSNYGNDLINYNSPTKYVTYKIPPIAINTNNLPVLNNYSITPLNLPNIYRGSKDSGSYTEINGIDLNGWTARKEARIRDKWIKIRIRYSGKNLAIIHSVLTLYNISYS